MPIEVNITSTARSLSDSLKRSLEVPVKYVSAAAAAAKTARGGNKSGTSDTSTVTRLGHGPQGYTVPESEAEKPIVRSISSMRLSP